MKYLFVCASLLLFSCQNGSDASDDLYRETTLKGQEEAKIIRSSMDTAALGAIQLYQVHYEIWSGHEDANFTYVVEAHIADDPTGKTARVVRDSVTQFVPAGRIWSGTLILEDAPVSDGPASCGETLKVNPIDHE